MPAAPQRQGRHTSLTGVQGRWFNFGGNRSNFAVTGTVSADVEPAPNNRENGDAPKLGKRHHEGSS